MNQKKIWILLGAVIVIVILGVGAYLMLFATESITPTTQITNTTNKATNTSANKTTNTSAKSNANTNTAQNTNINANPVGVKTYTSEKLGVKFNYLASEGDPVIEEGNTIYVRGKTGQFVEKITKTAADDLKTAIQKKFLAGISEKDCVVSNSTYDSTRSSSIDTAEIKYAFQITGLDDPRIETSPCPKNYRQTNGISYFWMDNNNPEQFFFFSIGQYSIRSEGKDGNPSGTEKPWQETFEVVK